MGKGIKYGGRVKGTPNKKTEALLEKCQRLGVDVFEGLLELCTHPEPSIKLGALKEILDEIIDRRKVGRIEFPKLLQKRARRLLDLIIVIGRDAGKRRAAFESFALVELDEEIGECCLDHCLTFV